VRPRQTPKIAKIIAKPIIESAAYGVFHFEILSEKVQAIKFLDNRSRLVKLIFLAPYKNWWAKKHFPA
jgi:hypothetical protein